MKKSRFTEEQIAYALKQAELGMAVGEICRKMGIAEATFYVWRKKYGFYPANTDTSDKPHHGAGGVSCDREESSAKSSSVRQLA